MARTPPPARSLRLVPRRYTDPGRLAGAVRAACAGPVARPRPGPGGDWFERGAADGFNVMPAALPSGLVTFAEQVIPIFRQRGLFRTEYTGATLREHYGIPRPDSQFAGAPEPAPRPPGVPAPVG
jgi:hypothetical protein